ncbi:MAG: mammalian cell entry protein [Pseudonocardiales bacterium]|nr:MAG: mammalian cell entry protein [Pseudonocardiales bacterium]
MSIGAILRRRVLGIAFLLLLCALMVLSVGFYTKAFTKVVKVTLVTDRIGNQLLVGSDVKLRGIIVGEVRGVHTDGRQATIDLALQPGKAGLIPANVTARLLPKTLFGERFVDLVLPADPAPAPIGSGAVIHQDATEKTLELERVFDDLLPLLRTLDPAKVNATLYALATALQGRGDQLGRNLVTLDAYLKQVNPEMPTIRADLVGLANLSETYADAAPDLLAALSNLSVTSATVTQQQVQVHALFRSTTALATTADAFFVAHEQRLIAVNEISAPILALVARYSPEFPCLLNNLTDLEPMLEKAFSHGRLHITLEIIQQRDKYRAGQDDPVYGDHRGPRCYQRYTGTAPFPGPSPELVDGSRGANVYTPLGLPPLPGLPSLPQGRALSDVLFAADQGSAGTAEETGLINPLLAPVMGVPSDRVPDIATLLFGPMARGTAVGLS